MTPPPARGPRPLVIAFRLVALLALVLAATWVSHMVRDALNLQIMPSNEQQVHRAIMVGLGAYVALLALPFVPGAEIGIALLTAFGASIAPLVYAATVVSMMLAFAVGRFLPVTALARLLGFLRLRRAAELVRRAAPLSRDARLEMLLDGAPARTVGLMLRHRYLALALAVNVPGNAVVGGGGGIMLMAGLSGICAPLPTFVAIALGVAPVPLAVLLFGA